MRWWKDARFGMFIHWGVYSVFGGEYDGHQENRKEAEWIMDWMKIPVAAYKAEAKNFNPIKFNAEAWVKMAKGAGMKYIVFTAKHHDGFAMFDTKASDWNIMDATPYRKDVLKALADACRNTELNLVFIIRRHRIGATREALRREHLLHGDGQILIQQNLTRTLPPMVATGILTKQANR
jgi:alpha-L-fucosidase